MLKVPCKICGKEVSSDAKFCSSCGAVIQVQKAQQEPSPQVPAPQSGSAGSAVQSSSVPPPPAYVFTPPAPPPPAASVAAAKPPPPPADVPPVGHPNAVSNVQAEQATSETLKREAAELERLEKLRIEKERLEQAQREEEARRLKEAERLELERKAQEAERIAQEQRYRARKERERAEREQREREAAMERERAERESRERLEREKREGEAATKHEQEERESRERAERERIDREMRENEQKQKLKPDSQNQEQRPVRDAGDLSAGPLRSQPAVQKSFNKMLLAILAIGCIALLGYIFTNQKSNHLEKSLPKESVPLVTTSETLKVGFVYVGPVGDAGWTFSHDSARKVIERTFGSRIQTTFVEKVPEGADAEAVIRDLVTQGNKLIFATSFGYGDALENVAKNHPDVKFEHAHGYKTAGNVRVYEGRTYEGAYLAGVIAGSMTKSKILGFVGSFPIPEVLRNINAYTLGAQSVNPQITTKVVWVNTWFNPPLETEATQALINQRADVILQSTDSTAVLQTAQNNGKFAFGWESDMSSFAPRAHLASAVATWAAYYEKAVNDVLNNSWKTEVTKWGAKEGMNDLIKINDVVPEDVRMKIADLKTGLRNGSFVVFRGPISDNTGKTVLSRDEIADDAWKGRMNFFVMGVEGKVPIGR